MAFVLGWRSGRNKLRPYGNLEFFDFYLYLAVGDASHRQRQGGSLAFQSGSFAPPVKRLSPLFNLSPKASSTTTDTTAIAVPIIVEPSCRGRPACRPPQNLKTGGHIGPPLQ